MSAPLKVEGNPTEEELAAVVAVLTAVASAAGRSPAAPPRRSEWAAPHRMMRGAHRHGPDGWKTGALPR